MDRETALGLLGEYDEIAHMRSMEVGSGALDDMVGIRGHFPRDGSERKAMRWLGYAQGVMHACGVFGLAELKEHSRRGRVG